MPDAIPIPIFTPSQARLVQEAVEDHVAQTPAPDMAHALVRTLLDGYFGPAKAPDTVGSLTTKGNTEEGRRELVGVIVEQLGALLVENAVQAVPKVADYCRNLADDLDSVELHDSNEVRAVLLIDAHRYERAEAARHAGGDTLASLV